MARFIQSTEIETKHEESNGVTRRGFLRLVLAGSGLFTGAAASRAFAAKPAFAATAAANDYPKQLKIAHLTDIHYFSPKLYSDCPDFTLAENSDRKMFKESAAIADKALADIVADQPDLIVVSGDLTKDGEQVCHQEIHDKIVAAQQQLKQAGKGTKVYVINGNHDINNNANGRDFSSGSAQPTPSATPAWFKDLWHDQCYNDDVTMYDAGGQNGGSLSYVARPCKGLTFIVVDSGKYSADQTESGQAEHETSGMISQKLLDWVCNQAKQAKAAGDVVIAMQHHGVVPHFGMEPEVLGEYLVDDYANVANAYADAGISCVFTGHMHANDIASVKSPTGNTIYDVETCATVTYPSDIRFSTLTWGRDAKDPRQVTATLELHSHALGAVAYGKYAETYKGAADIADITAYGNDHLLTPDVVKTMVGDVAVSSLLTSAKNAGDIKLTIAGFLKTSPAELDGTLFSMLANMLPESQSDGMRLDFTSIAGGFLKSYGVASIWHDANAGKIMFEQVTDDANVRSAEAPSLNIELTAQGAAEFEAAAAATPMETASKPWSLYITADSLTAFLADIYDSVDSAVVNDPTAAISSVKTLVDALMNSKVDAAHTIFDLVKYAYGDHLRGNETCDDWAEAAVANSKNTGDDANGNPVEDGSVTSFIRAAINALVADSGTKTLLGKIRFSLKKLLLVSDGFGNGPLGLLGIIGNLNTVFIFFKNPGNAIPNIQQLTDLAYNTLYTLTHDDNTPADRDFTLSAVAIDSDYKPEDNGDDGSDNQGDNGGTTDGGSNDSDNRGDGTQGGGNHNGTGADTENNSASSDKKPSANGSKKAAGLPQTGDISMATVAATAAIGAAAVGAGTWKALHHDEEEDNSLSK